MPSNFLAWREPLLTYASHASVSAQDLRAVADESPYLMQSGSCFDQSVHFLSEH